MADAADAADVAAFEESVAAWSLGRAPAPVPPRAVRTAVLVEGASDRAALLAAAGVLRINPASDGTAVLPMGGAMSVRRFANLLRGVAEVPDGIALRGLCDAGERRFFERAGVPARATGVCHPDLEGELIAALGMPRAEEILAETGDLPLFRTFQHQPAQRERAGTDQLHRFLGTTSGRKEQYAHILTSALPADRVPAPLLMALGP